MKKKKPESAAREKILKLAGIVSGHETLISIALLFAISFIYLFFFGKGLFFYHENRSLFIFSGDYLQKFASKPGGLLTYAANFLTQGYFSIFYGSLINSILLAAIYIVVSKIVKKLANTGAFHILLVFVPSLLLLISHTRYEYHLHQTLGFLLALVWFLISIRSLKKLSHLILIFLFPLFYYLAGAYALVWLGMYFTFSVIYESGRNRYIYPFIQTVVVIITYVLFSKVIFLQPFNFLLGYPLFFNKTTLLTKYLIATGALLILYPLILNLSMRLRSAKIAGPASIATAAMLFPVTVFILSWQYKPSTETVMKIEKMAFSQDWDGIISLHEKTSSTSIVSQFYYNLALSAKGQLCNRMFYGLQSYGPMSLALEGSRDQASRIIYYYYNIGLVNEARHLAFELMVQHGYTPENIKMLIKTELINGNFKVAERYINILSRTFHYRKWAEEHRRFLFDPEMVSTDKEFGEKKDLMPKEDFFIMTNDPQNIDLFLNSNPLNRKAFEYKIARLMLEKDIIAVTKEAGKLNALGYKAVPRHIEEVIVAYRNFSRDTSDHDEMKINPDAGSRFVSYAGVVRANKGTRELIEKTMKKADKNTFWYYLQFSTMSSNFLRSKPVDRNVY